jgi:NADH-quinone oxidoreductase subunit N
MVDGAYITYANAMPGAMEATALIPEALVASTALVLLLGGAFAANKRTDRLIGGLGLFVLVCLLGLMALPTLPPGRLEYFSHMFVVDGFSHFVKVLLIAATALTLLLSAGWLARGDNQRFEFPVLMLLSLLGGMLMVSANDLLSLYVGLELSSLPLYVLAAINRDLLKSTESGIKYFVLGSLASGMLLYGASLVYGFSGTTGFDGLAHIIKDPSGVSGGVVVGLVLIMVALSFKVSAAPFHMWTPDVYEGAPTPVTAFFSIVPKLAALALFTRVLIQPFGALSFEWQQIMVFVSVASMLTGAFGALMQTNIKRLLAYSSIGHIGYALMGLAAGTAEGVGSILIYFTLYIAMSAGAFACILMMNAGGEALEKLSDLAGLSRTRPRLAFVLAAFMFSMAGIPPLAGFFGKLYVFLAALHAGLVGLAVIGVLASVVACYYYLKVVKIMYFDEPALPFDKKVPAGTRLALVLCAALTLLFFVMPGPLVGEAQFAAQTLFAHPAEHSHPHPVF